MTEGSSPTIPGGQSPAIARALSPALLTNVRRQALRALIPAPRLRLSEWIEREIVLPEGVSARPGRVRLDPFQREMADAIGDPLIERVTLVKCVRIGFTTLLTSSVAAFVANDPAPILCLQPTESDARDFVVSDLEPTFEASTAVKGVLATDVPGDEVGKRNTILARRFPGGSLKVVASKAPRNLRRHTARVLLIDEADAMETTKEGSPIVLGEKRTMSFDDRKIVLGSTPLLEDTSHVLRAYRQSDQRVFEVACPECSAFTEIQWSHIEWPSGQPEAAAFRCPHCQALVHERHKPNMVAAGRWRATKPEVQGHAGFRLNALVSPLGNASWGKLAAEFLVAKEDSDLLQVFVNTILAQGWREAAVEVSEDEIAKLAEPFSLENIPPEVLLLTVGADVQDDRVELSFVGWGWAGPMVLGHFVVWGSPDDHRTWVEVDQLLKQTFRHPHGGTLRVDAAMIDSGDRTDTVYDFCMSRAHRKVWAVKGVPGPRPVCETSKLHIKGGGRLFLAGVDTIKATIYDRLGRGRQIRFSDTLQPSYFEQIASERKIVRYVRGQPVRRFERKAGYEAEALDALVYSWAARHMLTIPLEARAKDLTVALVAPAAGKAQPVQGIPAARSSYLMGER